MKPTEALRSFLFSSAFLAALTTAYAQTWDGSSSTSWNTGANWSGNAVPGNSAAITFNGTGINLNTTTDARFTLNSITFTSGQTSQVVINTTAGASAFNTGTGIRFNAGTNISVAAGNHKLLGTGVFGGVNYDVIFNGAASSTHTFNIASAASFEIQGRVINTTSNAKAFKKTGTGTLILSADNGGGGAWNHSTGTGFEIQQGALRFANANAGGNSSNNYIVSSGAALELTGGFSQGLGLGTHTLNGTGITSTGALRSISGNNTISGTGTGGVFLATNSSIGVDADSLTVTDDVKGPGGLTKVGSGTLVLGNADNSYAGATTVTGGTLAINGALTATTSVTVGTGAKLQGSGTINSSVTITIQGGGTLAPGNSIESLGGGAVSFLAGSTYAYEIQTNLYAGTPNDAADLTYSTGTLDIAAGTFLTLTDLATSTALSNGSKFTLISYLGGWTSGELFTYSNATLADNSTFTLGANQWRFDYDDTAGGLNFNSDQNGATRFVTMTVVPEPSAAFLGSIGLLALLRRRK